MSNNGNQSNKSTAPVAPVATLSAEQQAAVDAQFAAIAASVEAAEKDAADKIAAAAQLAADAEKDAADKIAAAAQSVVEAKVSNKSTAPLSSTLTIGCRLPNGIILEHPLDPNVKVELAGVHKSRIQGAPYGVTTVSRDFWDIWLALHKDFGPVKVGAIFAAAPGDIENVANEVAKEKTGFEGMPQDAMGIKKVEADK